MFEPVLPSLLSRQRSGCESTALATPRIGGSVDTMEPSHSCLDVSRDMSNLWMVQTVPPAESVDLTGWRFGSVSPFRRPDPNAAPRARVCVLTRSTANETGFARRALLLLTCTLVALPDIEARPVDEREPEWVSRLRS